MSAKAQEAATIKFLDRWIRDHGEAPHGKGWSVSFNGDGLPVGATLVDLPGYPARSSKALKQVNEGGVVVYRCPECNKVTRDEPDPLWECSKDDCGATFVSSDRSCEQCNRPFSRKEALFGCEDCLCEMEEVTFLTLEGAVDTFVDWMAEQ